MEIFERLNAIQESETLEDMRFQLQKFSRDVHDYVKRKEVEADMLRDILGRELLDREAHYALFEDKAGLITGRDSDQAQNTSVASRAAQAVNRVENMLSELESSSFATASAECARLLTFDETSTKRN
jgi:hypothetical protein